MKQILNAYYEFTVIPAIVLGCVSGLLLAGMNWYNTGMFSVTVAETSCAFLFFLAVMTCENVWDYFKKLWTALDSIG